LLTNLHELDDIHRTFLNRILDEEHKAEVDARALFRLTRVLHFLHKREVIVLVDEYDTPTSYATQHDYFPEVSPQAKYGLYFTQHFEGQHLLPRGFLSIAQSGCAYIPRPTTPLDLKLWNNEHLRGALMVSILRVAKADWFSGVNNLKVVQYLSFIAFYLTAVYRYICWVIEPDIRRRVCLRRRKHSYYTKHRRRNCKAVDRYGMAL
jgi:hypothetical protein